MTGDGGTLLVYTDGACRGNPGRGGWGWVVPDGLFAAGADPATTNNRMELRAALEALRAVEEDQHTVVCTDSTYITNCFGNGWWRGWYRRDWRTAAGKPVANRDLWEPLIARAVDAPVDFRWVKGHSGDRWNDVADSLATTAADSGQPRSGHVTELLGSGGIAAPPRRAGPGVRF